MQHFLPVPLPIVALLGRGELIVVGRVATVEHTAQLIEDSIAHVVRQDGKAEQSLERRQLILGDRLTDPRQICRQRTRRVRRHMLTHMELDSMLMIDSLTYRLVPASLAYCAPYVPRCSMPLSVNSYSLPRELPAAVVTHAQQTLGVADLERLGNTETRIFEQNRCSLRSHDPMALWWWLR